jgi:hypothetical protein
MANNYEFRRRADLTNVNRLIDRGLMTNASGSLHCGRACRLIVISATAVCKIARNYVEGHLALP